ncbi:unnamed protein product, partial [Rotaria sp. Silwood1]
MAYIIAATERNERLQAGSDGKRLLQLTTAAKSNLNIDLHNLDIELQRQFGLYSVEVIGDGAIRQVLSNGSYYSTVLRPGDQVSEKELIDWAQTMDDSNTYGDEMASIAVADRYHIQLVIFRAGELLIVVFTTLGIKSHGTITFRRNSSNKANFIRISPDVSPVQIKELFFQQCQHRRQSLVISITGSAREYNMKSKLFQIFRQGLLKVAKTTNVWIITNGVITSLTKLLGEIIRTNPDPSHPIHLIGIASWGCISGVEQLDVHGTNVIYNKSKNDGNDETPLEPNHTHFIFVDDGTKHQYGGENEFRTQFERAIYGESFSLQSTTNNNQMKDKSRQSDSIPVVLVVIEVHESVIKNKIPVVLLAGTGGCCDLFAKCYQLYNEYHLTLKLTDQTNEDSSSLREKIEQIKNKLREKLQIIDNKLNIGSCINVLDENTGIDYFELIYECIDKRSIFLNIVDLKVHNYVETDIDLAILQALLNVTFENDLSEMNIEQKREQLNLALEWQRIDIVKNFIMKDEKYWKTIELNDLFFKALIQNQANFIQLFLDHDFPLNDLFENNKILVTLYQNENYQLKHDFNNPLRGIYTEIIQPLIGEFFQVDAIFDSDDLLENNNDDLQSIELFLWSILTDKQELALLFWARGKNKICAALIATLIYKSKARKAKDQNYIEYANEFQSLAVEILEKFYLTNPYECTEAIIRQIPQFGNVTWLHLAVMAEAKLFIAHRGVQDVLNDIWNGYIDHRVGHIKIIFSTIMLWYSGFLPYHKNLVEGSEKCTKTNNFQDEWNFFQRNTSQLKSITNRTSDPACSRLMNDNLFDEDSSIGTSHWKRPPPPKIDVFFKFQFRDKHMDVTSKYFHVIFLILFSYVILCDFFPIYDFQCQSNPEEHSDSDILLKNVVKRSILNQTKTNLTINENSSSKFGLEQHNRPTTSEIILVLWMFTLFCEEIRQVLSMEVQSISGKLAAYFSIFWNKLDLIAIVLFFIAFILRLLPMSECFCSARIILAIDLSMWYIRTLDIFSPVKRLGPKLVMIGEMVHDLKFYMLMLTIFILAYGVPTYNLLYGVQKFSWHIPRAILNLAYWQIFGELEVLDDIEKNYEITGYVVFILLIAYMTVASVLLINLLIAMFSNTFDRLQLDTDCIWKFQHYSYVCY